MIDDDEYNLSDFMFSRIVDFNKTAYSFHNHKVSYKDVQLKSQSIATSLLVNGVRPRDRVLLLLNDTPAFTMSFLAIIQIGAIPVPLNPRSKIKSIRHYLNDSGAVMIIGEPETIETMKSLSHISLHMLSIITQDIYHSDNRELLNNNWFQVPSLLLSDCCNSSPLTKYYNIPKNSTVFWQYTSGTTGSPKAVMHKGTGMIKHTSMYAEKLLESSLDDIFYSTAKFFFGYGLGNSFFFPFYLNATTILDDRWPTCETVLNNICTFKPTRIFSAPIIYNQLLEYGEDISLAVHEDSRFVSAGSPLPGSLFNSWKYRHNIILLDGVGSTEMGHIYITNTASKAKAGVLISTVPEYDIKLVDKNNSSTNPTRGVLYIRGPSMSLGYYGLPDKNSEKYIDGWYSSGDVYTKDKNGYYTYIGREDDLFKIKGRWVSPLDIENYVLSNFNKIKATALVSYTDEKEQVKSALFYVVDKDIDIHSDLTSEISKMILEGFESHCLPSLYKKVSNLPINDNGKLMRQVLENEIQSEIQTNLYNKNYIKNNIPISIQ